MTSTINCSTSAGVVVTSDTSGSLALQTNSGVTALTIDTSQNSTFVGSVTSTTVIPSGSSAPTNGMFLPTTNTLGFSTASSERMRINSNGDLLVGTISGVANGGFNIQPNGFGTGQSVVDIGHINATPGGVSYSRFIYNNTIIGSIVQNGTTAVAYNTTSDHRLKTNVQPLGGALAKVQALKPSQFDWVDGRPDDGFIAHELQSVLPNVVTGEKDAVNEDGTPKYQQVDYARIVPTLTAAIQEQQALIQTLQTQVATLMAKVGE